MTERARTLRIGTVGLILVLALISLFGSPALAELPDLASQSAILIDADTGILLGQKAPHEKRAVASTTKMMTAILTLENRSLDDLVSTSEGAPLAGGSEVGLGMGDQLTVRDLLYSLMVASANDAAVVLAENIGEMASADSGKPWAISGCFDYLPEGIYKGGTGCNS